MGGRVVHFELPFDNAERAQAFYRDVFSWELMPIPEMGYTLVTTGPTGEQGATEVGFINGGMFERNDDFKSPNIVIDVENLEKALEAVTKAGGKIVRERQQVGDMGFTAYFVDTEGTLVGLWETAPQG